MSIMTRKDTKSIRGKKIYGQLKRYELIDTTADIGVKAYGNTLPEIFQSCAIAMFDIISETSKIEGRGEIDIQMEAPELGTLLVDFLNQLLYYKDAENYVFSKVVVDAILPLSKGFRLNARAFGEMFQRGKHVVGKDVKAATYHRLDINENEGYATVIFDI